MSKARAVRRGAVGAVLLLLTACHSRPPAPPVALPALPATSQPPPPPVAAAFADFARPAESAFAPARAYEPLRPEVRVPPFTIPRGLGTVANLDEFGWLDTPRRDLLAANGFLATPTRDEHLDAVYRRNASDGLPSFVTADVALFAFDRLHAGLATSFEHETQPALLTALTLTLSERVQAQVAAATTADLREANRHALAWLTVTASLLGVSTQVDATVGRLAQAELANLAARRPAVSPILGYALAYDRFVPPVGEQRWERARAAVNWLAIAVFKAGDDRVQRPAQRQLLVLLHALASPPERALRQWECLADSRSWLLAADGRPNVRQALAAADAIFGPRRRLADYDDDTAVKGFAQRLGGDLAWLAPVRRPDDALLEALAPAAPRGLPSGLALMQVLGQPRGEALVTDGYRVTTRFQGYAKALAAARTALAATEPRRWQGDLVRGRLWAGGALPPSGEGWPMWQRTAAWADKTLETSLAFWTAGRRRPEPAEPTGAPAAAEPPASGEPLPAYVEPAPEVYARLAWLLETTQVGLRRQALLGDDLEAAIDRQIRLYRGLKQMAEAELRNESLSSADRRRLAGIGEELRQLLRDPDATPVRLAGTAPLGSGVQVAVGPVQAILVVIPDRGKFYLARGAMASWHEFAGEPMSDAAWRAMIVAGNAPGQPEWAASFVVANRSAPELPLATAAPVWSR